MKYGFIQKGSRLNYVGCVHIQGKPYESYLKLTSKAFD